MARSSPEEKAPQQSVSARKSLTGDAHILLGLTNPRREDSKLRVKLN